MAKKQPAFRADKALKEAASKAANAFDKEGISDDRKIEELRHIIDQTIWMAIRYAHGRHTYAPEMVRRAVKHVQRIFPDWEPRSDVTIEPPCPDEVKGMAFRSDYLDDLFNPQNP